jgi:hypothetical protein
MNGREETLTVPDQEITFQSARGLGFITIYCFSIASSQKKKL